METLLEILAPIDAQLRGQLHVVSVANALIAWTVVYLMLRPALSVAGRRVHLMVLVAPHMFRYLGLVALAPHLFDMRGLGFSDAYHALIGYGDWLSGLLSLVALALLAVRSRLAIPAVLLFNIVGLADFANAGLRLAPAVTDPALIGDLGWILFTVYLPMLLVSHVAVFVVLLTPQDNKRNGAHGPL